MTWRHALDAVRALRGDDRARWEAIEAARIARFDTELVELLDTGLLELRAEQDAAREHRHPSGYGGAPVERDRPRPEPGHPHRPGEA